MSLQSTIKPHLKPAAYAAGGSVLGSVVSASYSAGSLQIPSIGVDTLKGLALPVAAGLVAAHLYGKNKNMVAGITGAVFPLIRQVAGI